MIPNSRCAAIEDHFGHETILIRIKSCLANHLIDISPDFVGRYVVVLAWQANMNAVAPRGRAVDKIELCMGGVSYDSE